MPENFDFLQNNKYEVGSIRNILLSASLNANRKTYKTSFHVIYAVVCALVMYLCIDTSLLAGSSIISTAAMFISPAMCVFPILYSPLPLKILSVLAPLIAHFIKSAATGFDGGFYSVAGGLFTYLLCVLCTVVFTKAVISGYTKNTVFVLITACYALIFILEIVFMIISIHGAFSLELVSKTVSDIYNALSKEVVSYASSDEGYAAYKMLFENMGQEVTKEFVVSQVEEALLTTQKVFVALLPFAPSFFAVSCMFYSFITVAVFSLFAKKFEYDVFVCIMDKKWIYRPSMLSVKIYDVVFFAFIISMFIKIPENISAAIINLFVILTPLILVSGIRCAYNFGVKKLNNKVPVIAIISAVLIVGLMTIGPLTFFIASSIGISFMITRDRNEKLDMPKKLMQDAETYNQLFKNKAN